VQSPQTLLNLAVIAAQASAEKGAFKKLDSSLLMIDFFRFRRFLARVRRRAVQNRNAIPPVKFTRCK
jgi:hypothetical protein